MIHKDFCYFFNVGMFQSRQMSAPIQPAQNSRFVKAKMPESIEQINPYKDTLIKDEQLIQSLERIATGQNPHFFTTSMDIADVGEGPVE